MKRIFLFLILSIVLIRGFSQNVPLDVAQKVATNWYHHFAPAEKQMATISNSVAYKHKEATCFYICTFDKGGFVMVSANNQAEPVLGYGFEGTNSGSKDSPEAKKWFNGYARQIDILNTNTLKSAEINPKWEDLLQNRFLKSGELSVGPLITTKWNQGCYFNALCPVDPGGDCGHIWTGCTATAMAQLMKYWNYPTRGTGSHSYLHPQYGNLNADFGATTYQWSQMTDLVTSSNIAVATLMYHAGVSAGMDYSLKGSGAAPDDALKALVKYFDYLPSAVLVMKDQYTEADWTKLIKSELDLKRPVLYAGYEEDLVSGHAFVCDGYQNVDYFHFNWGWGGESDGYFFVGKLNPSFHHYDSFQSALIKIVPSRLPDNYTGLVLSNTRYIVGADANIDSVKIASTINWTSNSDQHWLTLSNEKGTSGTSTLRMTFAENNTPNFRSANVTISATGFASQQIKVTQLSKVEVTAGKLNEVYAEVLSTITKLSITGTIDSRDFKTMRDLMPQLSVIDLSKATIVAYTGTDGTDWFEGSHNYGSNTIPKSAFFKNDWTGKKSLTSVKLPASTSSIDWSAFRDCDGLTDFSIPAYVINLDGYLFMNCDGLTSIEIPSSVSSIGSGVFWQCLNLSSIKVFRSTPIDLTKSQSTDVFTEVNKKTCVLYVPKGSRSAYMIADQWKDFANIVEMPNQVPVANASKDQSVGEGTTVTLDGSGSSDPEGNSFTYKWTAPNGIALSSNSAAKPAFIAPHVTQVTTFSFKLVVNDGTTDSSADEVVIIVNPIPAEAGSVSGISTVCRGQSSIIYTVPIVANATSYLWTLPNEATGTSSTNSISVSYGSSAASGNITVKGHNNFGDGVSSSFPVTVNSIPAGADAIAGPSMVCQGQNSILYFVPSINNATTYVWTLPSGATGTSNTNTISVSFGSDAVSGNITVKGHNDCGDGSTSTFNLTINPLPANAGNITGVPTLCQGTNSVKYMVSAIANATSYIWTLPSGATGTSAANNITVSFGALAVSGNITVKGHNDCGDGVAASFPITVNPIPKTPVVTQNGQALHSDFSGQNQWYNQNVMIPGATAQDYNITTIGEYTVIATQNGCSSKASNIIKDVMTSISSIEKNEKINVYPNPVTDDLTLEANENVNEIGFKIFNQAGQEIFTGNFFGKTIVHTSSFSSGIYLIRFDTGKAYEFKKIVKSR
jgi:hypothetical protein